MLRVRLQRMIKDERGFSLVELLAVAVILIILSMLAMPVYAGVSSSAKYSIGQTRISKVQEKLEEYYIDNGHYPHRLGLLVEQKYIKSSMLETPWSTPEHPSFFFYAVDNAGVDEHGRDLALGYALGDPGPRPTKGCDPNQAGTSLDDDDVSLPCGRNPKNPAWSFGVNPSLNAPCRVNLEMKVHDVVLATYYSLSECRKPKAGATSKRGNDLITELSVPVRNVN